MDDLPKRFYIDLKKMGERSKPHTAMSKAQTALPHEN